MSISYPIVILSKKKWDLPLAQEFFRFDNNYYSNDISFFETYFLGMKAVDCDGNLLKIVGCNKIPWHFFKNPFSRKWEIILEDLQDSISLEELKVLLIDLVSTISYQEQRDKWIEDIKRKTSIREIVSS